MMITIAQLTYEENGLPAALASVVVDHVVRDEDGVTVVPPEVVVQVQSPYLGTYEADFSPLNLDPSFNYTIHWIAITSGAITRNVTTQIAAEGLDSRAALRRRVGGLILGRDRFGYGGVLSATPNSVSARFVRRFPNEFFRGRVLYVAHGTGYGQEVVVSNSTQGSGELQVSPAWDVIPDASSVIELWSDRLTVDDVNNAINLAISDAGDIAAVREDRLLSLTGLPTDRLSVALPSDFTHIFQIEGVNATLWERWDLTNADPEEFFTIRNRRLYFPTALPTSMTELWVRGYRRPRRLHADQDICELPADYVVYMAASLLDMAAAEGQQLDPEQHAGRGGNWQRLALLRRNEILTPWEPNTMVIR